MTAAQITTLFQLLNVIFLPKKQVLDMETVGCTLQFMSLILCPALVECICWVENRHNSIGNEDESGQVCAYLKGYRAFNTVNYLSL